MYGATTSIEGRRIRRFSRDLAVKILSRYAETGFTQFFFSENIFNLPASHTIALYDQIIKRQSYIKWQAIIYPGKTDERLAD